MILTAIARLGRDAELRHTPNGNQVCELALAVNYGRKDGDGKRPTQWISASLWGQRAESLAPYLLKGQQVYVVLEEPHIETFEGRNGPGHKLVGRVVSIEFAGPRPDGQPAPQRSSAPPQPAAQQPRQQQPNDAFGNFDDDIPF